MGILQFIFARARSTQESSHRFHACSPVRWFLLFRCWRCCCCCCRAYCTWIRPHSTHSSARSHCQPHNPSYIHINFTFARNQVAIFRNILIYSFNAKNYMMYFVRNQCSYTQSFLHIQYIYVYKWYKWCEFCVACACFVDMTKWIETIEEWKWRVYKTFRH